MRLAVSSNTGTDPALFDKLPGSVQKAAGEQGLKRETSSSGIRIVGSGDKVDLVLDTNGDIKPVVLPFECLSSDDCADGKYCNDLNPTDGWFTCKDKKEAPGMQTFTSTRGSRFVF